MVKKGKRTLGADSCEGSSSKGLKVRKDFLACARIRWKRMVVGVKGIGTFGGERGKVWGYRGGVDG